MAVRKGTGAGAAKKGAGTEPNKALVGLLVVLIVVAIAIVVKVGGGLLGSVNAENQRFGPSAEMLKKASLPGYTPYGQMPKPGEYRPINPIFLGNKGQK
jgi:hypothetical protein